MAIGPDGTGVVKGYYIGPGADLRGADLRGDPLTYREWMDGWRYPGYGGRVPHHHPMRLDGADLRGADLRGANLNHVSLEGANLEDANLEGADLDFANLRGANLTGATMPNGSKSISRTPNPASGSPGVCMYLISVGYDGCSEPGCCLSERNVIFEGTFVQAEAAAEEMRDALNGWINCCEEADPHDIETYGDWVRTPEGDEYKREPNPRRRGRYGR